MNSSLLLGVEYSELQNLPYEQVRKLLWNSSVNVINDNTPLLSFALKSQGQKYTAILDSGAGINCISEHIVQKHKLFTYSYDDPMMIGMAIKDKQISITRYVKLQYKIGQFTDTANFSVLPGVSQNDIILGLPWMKRINPSIPNWQQGDMFVTKTRLNGKIATYKCKAIHTDPYSNPLNKGDNTKIIPPTQAQLNRLCKSKNVEIYCIIVKDSNFEITPINSLAMQKAAEEAKQFAEQAEEFQIPSFEEPPLYKLSEPLTPEQQIILDKIISDNSEVLRSSLPDSLPPHRPGDGPIAPTLPGTEPMSRSPFKLSPAENLEIKRQLEEYINKGFLQPTNSPWGAPVFLVRKSHSHKLRLVCDWMALNKATIKNKFAMPHPELLFDKLKGSKYFTKIDLSQGFHQLRLSDDDRAKSAITTRYGNFEWTVAAFGMSNVPSVFSRVVGDVLWEYQDKFVINFMDDILIYSPDFDSHVHHISMVLDKLKSAQLYANPDKCTWFATSVHYLGHEISEEVIRVSKEKVKAIMEWPRPESIKELRSFLGLASFYRKHIKGFAFIAEPLHNLLKKDTKWVWKGDHKQAFNTLKKCLSEAPVLLFPDFNLPFTICPDSSGYAIGGVLMQDHGNGLQPICYESRKMIPAERNYPVHEQELLAILHCCKKWRHYILNQTTNVATDHAPLKFLQTQPNLSARQVRWLDFLSQYDLNIAPQPGKFNMVGDALSRRPDHVNQLWHIYNVNTTYKVNVVCSISLSGRVNDTFSQETDYNSDIKESCVGGSNYDSRMTTLDTSDDNMTTPCVGGGDYDSHLTVLNTITSQSITSSEYMMFSAIQNSYSQDEFILPLLTKSTKEVKTSHGKYILVNNLVYYVTSDARYLLYIPPIAKLEDSDISLQQAIIQECHDALYAGHYGSAKTTLRVQQQFHWPGMHDDIIALY